jgi:hypothetical protein
VGCCDHAHFAWLAMAFSPTAVTGCCFELLARHSVASALHPPVPPANTSVTVACMDSAATILLSSELSSAPSNPARSSETNSVASWLAAVLHTPVVQCRAVSGVPCERRTRGAVVSEQ